MSKRFTKPAINWKDLERRVPIEQKPNFLAFKAKSDLYLRKVLSNPPEPPKIDWETYKKSIPVPGLVEKFKKEYECLKVPFPCDPLTCKIDEQRKTLELEIKEFCAEQQKHIDAADQEIRRISSLPKFEDMNMEMYYDIYPDKAQDFVKKQSFWPHTPEEQPDYKSK